MVGESRALYIDLFLLSHSNELIIDRFIVHKIKLKKGKLENYGRIKEKH